MEFVVKAKMKIVELMEPIINIKFANNELDNQQEEEEKRKEIFNNFINKKREALTNSSLSNDERNAIVKEMEKEKDNQYGILSEEYKKITEQLEVKKREIIISLTNYFRHVDETQSLKLSLLDALEIYGVHIEDHIPADILKEYGL